jgi:DNA primase
LSSFEIVKQKIKLSDIADQDLNLKRSGRVMKATCPFHDDRTPSFTLYPTEQTFNCFGCGKNGTVIDYIMYRESIKEPYEAVEYLAGEYNLDLPGFDTETFKRKKEIINKNRTEALTDYKNVKQAEQFLLERGFKQETIKKFGVGFNVNHNAITIPYLDTYGNVAGISYRNMDDDKPKYVNSAEDEVFKKSNLLYGLDKARKHIKDKVFIVEGYFDVMALHEMGYKESVAYCGQSMTDGQATLLSKYVNRNTKIFLIPDNDKTGMQQVANNIKLIRQRMRNAIGVVTLPEGIKDANDILRFGTTIDRFESEHHEMFLLKQELDKCLEQQDEYEVAQNFVKYTQNEMIRAEMADYLSKRWNKSKEVVHSFMKSEETTLDYESDLKTFDTAMEGYKEILNEGTDGRIFFNMRKVDRYLNGMKRGEVCFLMGRSGAGKTTIALNLIHNAVIKQGHNVVFNSLELNSENIVPQLLQIQYDEVEGKVANMVLEDKLEDGYFLDTINKRLRIIDRPGQTVDDIERYALMANEIFDNPISMIVIDYFQYIKMGRGEYNEISQAARRMKDLAKKLNCLVFVLSQTSRDGGTDGSTPLSLQSARDTGAIEETGDYVLGVYRPASSSKLTEIERQEKQHEYYLQVLKNRWGPIGKAKLHFTPQSKIITNWEDRR